MSLHLSDEILMAFADGELDEPVAAAVAKAIAENADVAKRVREFQRSRSLTRSAFTSLMPDVSPELEAAVSSKIKFYEGESTMEVEAPLPAIRSGRSIRRLPLLPMAMAASIAAVALTLGFFVGRQGGTEPVGLFAQLESPLVRHELSRIPSGKDVDLPFGRLRVISSYQVEKGSLCREFRLRSAAETVAAVACRKSEWTVTFAAADGSADGDYTPSGGEDLMATYLQSIDAGQPLTEPAEANALAEFAR